MISQGCGALSGGSDKHRRDIRSMLAVSGDRIDRAALDHWIKRRGLAAEWGKVTSGLASFLPSANGC